MLQVICPTPAKPTLDTPYIVNAYLQWVRKQRFRKPQHWRCSQGIDVRSFKISKLPHRLTSLWLCLLLVTGFSSKPTVSRTRSSSANHSSFTLLTLLWNPSITDEYQKSTQNVADPSFMYKAGDTKIPITMIKEEHSTKTYVCDSPIMAELYHLKCRSKTPASSGDMDKKFVIVATASSCRCRISSSLRTVKLVCKKKNHQNPWASLHIRLPMFIQNTHSSLIMKFGVILVPVPEVSGN